MNLRKLKDAILITLSIVVTLSLMAGVLVFLPIYLMYRYPAWAFIAYFVALLITIVTTVVYNTIED
jgi:hypothetical protein